MVGSPLSIVRYAFNAVFDPAAIVSGRENQYTLDRRATVRRAVRLSLFYFLNLFLYAIPLTYAGFGTTSGGEPPAAVASVAAVVGTNADATWQFLLATVQNCTFLFLASVLTFATFHVGVSLTRESLGVLQSIHTVVYSTGIYLAAIFSLAWYLSTSPEITVAGDWLVWVQAEFIYAVIDLTGTDLVLPGGRPAAVGLDGMTRTGTVALGALFATGIYYLYSLYLGARINHDSSRFASALAVGFVVVSPALFVIGSVATTVVADGTLATVALSIDSLPL
ncbi:hypothetical protein [Natrinema versiforme]|uniref:Uncharacterized protein n=1 Tax=Natrinema versiforme JCM 10478 TaxID=1227496 RepID=L9XTS3_9EURY|nr:hypothetical protein [Natrinema versiforme]ELY65204.1 hypothetical protein C489_15527 [Natrinema versiforme JCM 10478]